MSLSIYARPLQQQLTVNAVCIKQDERSRKHRRVQRCICPLFTENMQVLGVCQIVKLFVTLRMVWL